VNPVRYGNRAGEGGSSSTFGIAGIQYPVILVLQDWVGKSRAQLVMQKGEPSSTAASANGGTFYNYNMRTSFQGRGATGIATDVEFDIDSDGTIISATSTAL
jgi:hypothetical protein